MHDFTVSWVILTYNRADKVERAITHCMRNAGEKWDELVWCDNGSADGVRDFMMSLEPDTAVLNKANRGVASGYNRAMAMATCDYVVITGCDMLMPPNWLKTFKDYIRRVPRTGIACMYSGPLGWVPERARDPKDLPADSFTVEYNGRVQKWYQSSVNGLPFVHAMPIGRRILSRKLLGQIGYFPECFGLYGHDDVAWAHRAEKICDMQGLHYYVIPDQIPEHLGTEGVAKPDGKDESQYHAFKMAEAADPEKARTMSRLQAEGWPYFNPFTHQE